LVSEILNHSALVILKIVRNAIAQAIVYSNEPWFLIREISTNNDMMYVYLTRFTIYNYHDPYSKGDENPEV